MQFGCSIVGEGQERLIDAPDHRSAARSLVLSGDAQPENYILVRGAKLTIRFRVSLDRRLTVASHYDASPDRAESAAFFSTRKEA